MTFFDAHSDIWNDVTRRRQAGEREVFRRHHQERLKRGGCQGGIFAIWIEKEYGGREAERTGEIVSCVRAEAGEADFRIVRSMGEFRDTWKAGGFPVLMGAEGLAAIGADEGKLDIYYHDYGVRLAMLTWNEANALAAGAMSGEDGGLTGAGRRAVRRIRELGMVLDVSHLNEAGFRDVISLTGGPVVASHSNCRALCDVPRNLTDDQLRAIRDTGGVVGVNAFHGFVSADPARQTVEELARHAAHMAEVMGVEHVCCGFDFCEFLPGEGDCNVRGMRDCGEAQRFFRCLTDLGMSEQEQILIARENLLRVLERVVG